MFHQTLKTSTIITAKDQVWCEMAGEAVILHLKSGIYYGLNPVGARIWSLIQDPRTVDSVLTALVEEYEVDPNRCEQDLFALLQDLQDRGLIEIRAEFDGAVR